MRRLGKVAKELAVKSKRKNKLPRRPSVMERTETYGNIELRYKNAELDEIVIQDEAGKCIFHMEWQHDNAYWMGITGSKKRIDIDFESEAKIRFKVRNSI